MTLSLFDLRDIIRTEHGISVIAGTLSELNYDCLVRKFPKFFEIIDDTTYLTEILKQPSNISYALKLNRYGKRYIEKHCSDSTKVVMENPENGDTAFRLLKFSDSLVRVYFMYNQQNCAQVAFGDKSEGKVFFDNFPADDFFSIFAKYENQFYKHFPLCIHCKNGKFKLRPETTKLYKNSQ